MANFNIGDYVIATPKDNDFNCDFSGFIISNNKNLFQ